MMKPETKTIQIKAREKGYQLDDEPIIDLDVEAEVYGDWAVHPAILWSTHKNGWVFSAQLYNVSDVHSGRAIKQHIKKEHATALARDFLQGLDPVAYCKAYAEHGDGSPEFEAMRSEFIETLNKWRAAYNIPPPLDDEGE